VDQRHSDLLWELRYAMDEAFGKSERVIAAIVALQNAGQGFKMPVFPQPVPPPEKLTRIPGEC
jgi:hypothetical protein